MIFIKHSKSVEWLHEQVWLCLSPHTVESFEGYEVAAFGRPVVGVRDSAVCFIGGFHEVMKVAFRIPGHPWCAESGGCTLVEKCARFLFKVEVAI